MFRFANVVKNVYRIVLLALILFSTVWAEKTTVRASGLAFSKALAKSKRGDTLVLEAGKYRGDFIIPPQVSVISKELHKAVLNGRGNNRTVVMMNGSAIHGVAITGARVGVYSEGIDNSITGCLIYGNRHSGIVAVATLPEIRDNIIVRNQGSGITLWDIKSDTTAVSHNTIAYNTNHGISVGGESEVTIDHNIIAYNHRLKIKVDDRSKITQEFNNYYFNIELNELLPEKNFTFDPKFRNPSINDFRLQESSRCINGGLHGSTIGSEIFINE